MKKSFLIIVLFLISIVAGCSGSSGDGGSSSSTHPKYAWTKQMGGSGNGYGRSITRDSSGNVYLTGWFSGTVDFGADFGTSDSKTSSGNNDIFVTKINANGTYAWTKQMGGSNNTRGYSITTDTSGNVYLTGFFMDTVDFGADFGISDTKTPLTTSGYSTIFVTKINANGTYAWTKQMGGSGASGGRATSITTDTSGNVYLTGGFGGTVDFGADFGTSDSKTSSGDGDIFVTKINANGTYAWTKRMGGSGYDEGYSITTDSSGNVYLTGLFKGTVDFGNDFGKSETKTSSGDYDIFVTKINASGTYAWTKRMGGSGYDEGYSITTDSSGNVYLTGEFDGTADFGADFGKSDTKTLLGGSDIFVTKILP